MDFLKENQNTLTNIQRAIEEKQKLRGTLDDTIQILNEKVSKLTEKYELMMNELTNARKEVPELQRQADILVESIAGLTLQNKTLESSLVDLSSQLQSYTDLTTELKTLQEQVQTLKDDVSTETAIKTDLEGQTNNLKGLRNTLQTEVEYLQTEIKDLQPELDKNTNLLRDILKEKEHAQNIFNNASKVLEQVEISKTEFIENPLSIGYYAELIKRKHGIDIIKLMR